jgi:hypothetical protein
MCFTPDHDGANLNVRSLNRSDRAALTTLEVRGVSGMCFAPDHEAADLSLEALNRGDQAVLALA